MPIALCSLSQMNIPLSSVEGKAPNFIRSSFNFKYQTMLACICEAIYTFLQFPYLTCIGFFRDLTYTVRSIALPCKNAVLTSTEFNVHLLDGIIEQVKWSPSLDHVALSVLKFCSSSNLLPIISLRYIFHCWLIFLWLPILERCNFGLDQVFPRILSHFSTDGVLLAFLPIFFLYSELSEFHGFVFIFF